MPGNRPDPNRRRFIQLLSGSTASALTFSQAVAADQQGGRRRRDPTGGSSGGLDEVSADELKQAIKEEIESRQGNAGSSDGVEAQSIPSDILNLVINALGDQLPLSGCTPNTGYGTQFCMDASDVSLQNPDCAYSSPTVHKMDLNLEVYSLDFFGRELTADIEFWVGYSLDGCWWTGMPQVNGCAEILCDDDLPDSGDVAAIADQMVDVGEEVADFVYDHTGQAAPGTTSRTVLIALVAVALAVAIAAPPTGVPG